MSSFSSTYKTVNVSASSREQAVESGGLILSQSGCSTHDQGQMLGTEFGLMEMTEVEYSHLQHFFQAHMETQAGPPDGPDARSHPATVMLKDTTGSTGISPFTSTQAIDLSTSSDDHCLVMPGEKTPVSYGEVPGFVLARIRGEESAIDPPAGGVRSHSQKRSRSAARVCLEKRFNTMSADITTQPDFQSAVFSNFLTILQQSTEAQEAVIQPQKQKWKEPDRANGFEVPSSYVGGVFDPVTNMCGQVLAHMVEPNKHQGVIIPKTFLFNLHPERVASKVHYTSSGNPAEEQQLVMIEKDVATPAASRSHCSVHCSLTTKAAKAKQTADSAGKSQNNGKKKARPCLSISQRKERHNSKERERRKRIRLCCDELNTMVPFCDSDTDKVTTLQWTTTFLRYLSKTYGDLFKEEFQKFFILEKGLLKSSCPPGEDAIQQEMNETLSKAEQ
ncbi:transcription factor-like 5 protein [Embiotoca jacksoni]|uniref:transcription factor-like 5 protein n=1 Tax=Embiotoca jacksoni TaxID=100190 RepID=UPI0037042160